jgi:hypothetical protein
MRDTNVLMRVRKCPVEISPPLDFLSLLRKPTGDCRLPTAKFATEDDLMLRLKLHLIILPSWHFEYTVTLEVVELSMLLGVGACPVLVLHYIS